MNEFATHPILQDLGVTLDQVRSDEVLLAKVQLAARTRADIPLIGELAAIRRYQVENSRYSIVHSHGHIERNKDVVDIDLPLPDARKRVDELQALSDAKHGKRFGHPIYYFQRQMFKAAAATSPAPTT